ncbi:hypothetical protein [Dehalogenimonas etheniformans]|uniref:Uncharacterized protein n=1 Tax=Dehalogenimonas etheniformans TaxID=1536648 RepID=A0A2P5P4Z5_9CHLR|nr:hypothetical protein [Dehalogenimonas etheniformans]PPD57372.1 hypothetical protein JP09_010050 [Dehalogenimonas etheniformans]QNT75222.1 hypothetical protein HX448_00195 [Dehalogenimonas etheniformans]
MTTMTITETKELQSCCECGHTGTDLVGYFEYIGGQGYVPVFECQGCIDARLEASREAVEALKLAMMLGE